MSDNLLPRLQAGVDQLGLSLNARQLQALLTYVELLQKWNKAYNLTAIRSPEQMIDKHILDSLAVVKYLKGERFADIGTGAGLPGIPLAIACPERHFDLVDSLNKRTRFLFQVKTTLGLDNIAIHHSRAEAFQPESRYDGVLSRAFASLEDMLNVCGHLCHGEGEKGGVFYAMKGKYPEAELANIDPGYPLLAAHRLAVPGIDEERHLVVLGAKPDSH